MADVADKDGEVRLRTLLVATDGSAAGERVVAFAIALARRFQSEILLCHVIDTATAIAECSSASGSLDPSPVVRALHDAAESILRDAGQRVVAAGVVTSSVTVDGRFARAIVSCAHEWGVDAIVIGTQGKAALEQVFLGSTAQGVLRHAAIPTFVVPPGANQNFAFDRMLVAVDDSGPSDAAAALACDLARGGSARLVVCGVAEMGELLDASTTFAYDTSAALDDIHADTRAILAVQIERARQRGVDAEILIIDGEPAAEILKAAASGRTDLIVLGTHGRRGLRRLFVGSVAETIVRRSTVPVCVVRSGDRGSVRAAMKSHSGEAVSAR